MSYTSKNRSYYTTRLVTATEYNLHMNARPLLVPPGTNSQRFVQFQGTFVDNGLILNKVFVVEEAGKPPAQVQQSLVFLNLKDALENISKDA